LNNSEVDLRDLTVTICTLNEEQNIGECISRIKSAGVTNILVVDATSTDDTASIARSQGARVIVVPRSGLASQRQVCVEQSNSSLIALLDADHRPTNGCFEKLITEMRLYGWDGVEAQIESEFNTSYWDSAMEFNFKISHNEVGPRKMIGTPCVYKRNVLINVQFDKSVRGPSDDTDLCYRLELAGYSMGVGSAVIKQVHRATFKEFYKKWLWYGSGDAEFVMKHPRRTFSILYHQLGNYGIKKSLISIKTGNPKYVFFFMVAGILRFSGMLKGIFLKLVFQKLPKIHKT